MIIELTKPVSRICAGTLTIALFAVLSGCHRDPLKVAADAYAKGQDYEKKGKVTEAILEYRRAEQNNSRLYEAHLRLAHLYTERGEFNNGIREVKALRSLKTDDPDANNLTAQYMVMSRQFDDARKLTGQILSLDLKNKQALLTDARASLGLHDLARANSDLATILEVDPKDADALYIRAGIEQANGKTADSEATLRQEIAIAPDNFLPVQVLAASLASHKDLSGCEALLTDFAKKHPDNMQAQITLGQFYAATNRTSEAEQQYRKVSEAGDKSPKLRATLAMYYLQTNRLPDAEKEYKAILSKHSDDFLNRRGLAVTYLYEGKKDDARKEVESVLKDHPSDADALFLRGRIRVIDSNFDGAIQDFQRVAQLTPNSGLPHYWLGLIYIDQNKAGLATTELQSALQLNPNMTQARLILATLENKEGEKKDALGELDKIIQQHPDSATSYVLKADMLAQSGDVNAAEKTLDPILSQENAGVARESAFRAMAGLKYQQRKFAEARTAAEKALQLVPRDQQALLISALCYAQEKQPAKGTERIAQQLAAQPGWAGGYKTQGEYFLALRQLPEAQHSFEEALKINPNQSEIRIRLGDVLTAMGKLDDAVNVYAQSNDPRLQPTMHLHLAQAYELKQDWSSAQAEYNKVLQLTPENAVAKNNLAWVLLQHGGSVDQALKLAQEARSAAPDSANVADTLGMIYIAKNSYGNAIQLLQDSVKRDPANPSYEYHLGIAYAKDGRKPEAVAALHQALKLSPSFSDAQGARDLLKQLE